MFQKNSTKPNKGDSKDSKEAQNRSETKSKDALTGTNVILADVEIKGTVKFKNDVIIDGKIDGEIVSDGVVTIGPHATVNAEIRSKSVIVEGSVHGNIYATDRLELSENAQITGDIKAAILSMQAGAVLVGTSSVGSVPSKPSDSKSEQHTVPERELAHA